ncbi:MAG: hypothetical protein WKF34_14165 [Pyrinomonadaceae bacterium]
MKILFNKTAKEATQKLTKTRIKILTGREFLFAALLLAMLSVGAFAQARSQSQMHEEFRAEAGQYFRTISVYYYLYRPDLAQDTGGLDRRAMNQAQADFSELGRLCFTKYRGIANPTDPQRSKNIAERFGDWCDMADRQNEFRLAALEAARKNTSGEFVYGWRSEINKALTDTNGVVWDDVQTMLFEPAKWKAKEMIRMEKMASENGGTVPANIFDSLARDLQPLKAKIENDSKTNKWEAPGHKDAAIEGLARAKYLAAFKGIVIVQSGMDSSGWKVFKNFLGIPTEQIKGGWLLVKMPNQSGLCQGRQFSVKKTYMGGGRYSAMKLNGYSEAGIYMVCN